MQLVFRFIVGGLVVSFFAVIGDGLKPKSFAGLFGAAPSVALATLTLAVFKDGKVYALSEGAVLEIETQHRFTIVNHTNGHALISGHTSYRPEPVPVRVAGSTWGGSMLKLRYIGRGMHLEFCHPTYHTITTSCVAEIGTVA